MDDVVADWGKAADELLQQHLTPEERTTKWLTPKEWNRIRNDVHFYLTLPVKPGANELVSWAKQYASMRNMDLAFLTALPHADDMPAARPDKIAWASKYFPGIPVLFGPFSTDKWKHCKLGDILIDDRPDNCVSWRKAGGIAHVYTTWPKCKRWIETVLDSK